MKKSKKETSLFHFLFLGVLCNLVCGFLFPELAVGKIDFQKAAPLVLPDQIIETNSTSQFLSAVTPPTYLAGQDGDAVALHIADNSLKYLWNNSALKHSAAGRIATRVEETVQVEAKVTTGDLNQNEKQIQHTFNFDVQGLQALARIKYKGWVNAALLYSMKSSEASAEVSEKVFTDKDLVMSQVISSTDSRSQISLRWDW